MNNSEIFKNGALTINYFQNFLFSLGFDDGGDELKKEVFLMNLFYLMSSNSGKVFIKKYRKKNGKLYFKGKITRYRYECMNWLKDNSDGFWEIKELDYDENDKAIVFEYKISDIF
jgi:hypothetical protein